MVPKPNEAAAASFSGQDVNLLQPLQEKDGSIAYNYGL